MNKELEENLKELLEKSNQKDKCDICITNNTLETILNYIENSIPTSVVLEKLNKKKQEREIYWLENEIMLNFIHDEKRATISLEELKINDKSMELLGEIKCLQELLQRKGEE